MSREPMERDDDALLAEYLDGALDDATRAQLAARLSREPALRDRLAAERVVRERAGALLEQWQLPAGRGAMDDLAKVRARVTASRDARSRDVTVRDGAAHEEIAPDGARTPTITRGAATRPAIAGRPTSGMPWRPLLAAALVLVVAAPVLVRWVNDRMVSSLEKPASESLVLGDEAMPASAPVAEAPMAAAPAVAPSDPTATVAGGAPPAPAAARGTGAPTAADTRTREPIARTESERRAATPPSAPSAVASAAPAQKPATQVPAAQVPAADAALAAAPPPAGGAAGGVTTTAQRAQLRRGNEVVQAETQAAKAAEQLDAQPMRAPAAQQDAAQLRVRDAVPPRTVSTAEAAILLDAPPLRLRGAGLVRLTAGAGTEIEAIDMDREVVVAVYRDRAAGLVTLAQQRPRRTAADSSGGWRVIDGVRVRILGDVERVRLDSLWLRVAR